MKTLTTDEHLNAIVAKCKANIAITEDADGDIGPDFTYCEGMRDFYETACGTALSGWRSTIAAISALQSAHRALPPGDDTAWRGLLSIIAAWPIELL